MAIELVVEDGTGLPNANSYISVADARAYAESRGMTLATDDDDLIVDLIQGADFIGIPQYACKYGGEQLTTTQALAWPRKDVTACGVEIPDGVIPARLKYAQVAVAAAIESGVELYPNGTGAPVKQETVGPLTTIYDVTGYDPSDLPTLSQVNALLAGLFDSCGCGPTLRTLRV